MYHSNQNSPAIRWVSVTPSNTTILPAGCRGLYIGGAGNVAMADADGAVVTFTAVPVGTFMPVAPTKVMSTNTTATLIVALY